MSASQIWMEILLPHIIPNVESTEINNLTRIPSGSYDQFESNSNDLEDESFMARMRQARCVLLAGCKKSNDLKQKGSFEKLLEERNDEMSSMNKSFPPNFDDESTRQSSKKEKVKMKLKSAVICPNRSAPEKQESKHIFKESTHFKRSRSNYGLQNTLLNIEQNTGQHKTNKSEFHDNCHNYKNLKHSRSGGSMKTSSNETSNDYEEETDSHKVKLKSQYVVPDGLSRSLKDHTSPRKSSITKNQAKIFSDVKISENKNYSSSKSNETSSINLEQYYSAFEHNMRESNIELCTQTTANNHSKTSSIDVEPRKCMLKRAVTYSNSVSIEKQNRIPKLDNDVPFKRSINFSDKVPFIPEERDARFERRNYKAKRSVVSYPNIRELERTDIIKKTLIGETNRVVHSSIENTNYEVIPQKQSLESPEKEKRTIKLKNDYLYNWSINSIDDIPLPEPSNAFFENRNSKSEQSVCSPNVRDLGETVSIDKHMNKENNKGTLSRNHTAGFELFPDVRVINYIARKSSNPAANDSRSIGCSEEFLQKRYLSLLKHPDIGTNIIKTKTKNDLYDNKKIKEPQIKKGIFFRHGGQEIPHIKYHYSDDKDLQETNRNFFVTPQSPGIEEGRPEVFATSNTIFKVTDVNNERWSGNSSNTNTLSVESVEKSDKKHKNRGCKKNKAQKDEVDVESHIPMRLSTKHRYSAVSVLNEYANKEKSKLEEKHKSYGLNKSYEGSSGFANLSYTGEYMNKERKSQKEDTSCILVNDTVANITLDIKNINSSIIEKLNSSHEWIACHQPKVYIIGDSHTRFLAFLLINMLPGFKVESFVKPSAKCEQVLSGLDTTITNMTKEDFLVILGGTNDMWSESIEDVKDFLQMVVPNMEHTNVLLCNVPNNYCEPPDSYVQYNIRDFNNHLEDVILRTNKSVKLVNINNLNDKSYYTKHGLHFNMDGKIKICEEISKNILKVLERIKERQ